jgi:hypothetical protein
VGSLRLLFRALPFVACAGCASSYQEDASSLRAEPQGDRDSSPLDTAVERIEICVGSSLTSAGELADALVYDVAELADGTVAVGYYAFFSDERPWANNWLTWSVLPALAVDLVYSRALFALPGLRALLYGPGDVEGFRIHYRRDADGSLAVERAVADDGMHAPVALTKGDLFRLDAKRPTLYTEVWSHQLGGTSARALGELVSRKCYAGASLRPLTAAVARTFRLDGRAPMAHVERLRASNEAR